MSNPGSVNAAAAAGYRAWPFHKAKNQEADWTLLVSGVNLQLEQADRLLRRFSFIPQARLDDVMVRYARRAVASARTSTPTTFSCCRDRAGAPGISTTENRRESRGSASPAARCGAHGVALEACYT